MDPLVKTLDVPKEPTCGQLDNRLLNLFPKDQRTNDWMLHDWPLRHSVLSEIGQSELMGSIRCTQIPLILVTTNQSHLSLLSRPYSANPLVDLKTHIGTGTIELFFVMILTTPPPMLTNLCSMFSSFLCHDHILLHLLFTIIVFLLTVSPTLVPLLTHSLLLSIFS